MIIKLQDGFVERGGWWVVAQVVLFALILVGLTRNQEPVVALQILGWALVAVAAVLGGSALWLIRDKITAMPAPLSGAVLLERGPFALVRHPIYGAVILGFFGLSVKGGNIVALGLSMLLVPFFLAKTRHEEKLLSARFPDYAAYRSRVRYRVLPWVL